MQAGVLHDAGSIETHLLLLHAEAGDSFHRAYDIWRAERLLHLEELVWLLVADGKESPSVRQYLSDARSRFLEIQKLAFSCEESPTEKKVPVPSYEDRLAYIRCFNRGFGSLDEILTRMKAIGKAAGRGEA